MYNFDYVSFDFNTGKQVVTPRGGYTSLAESNFNITEEDAGKIHDLMRVKRKADKRDLVVENAQTYFKKYKRPLDNIALIIFDAVNAEGRTRKEGKAEKLTLPKKDEFEDARINAFGKGTGKLQADRALEWVRKNLSLQTNNWITNVITNNESKIASESQALDGSNTSFDTTTAYDAIPRQSIVDAVQENQAITDEFFEADAAARRKVAEKELLLTQRQGGTSRTNLLEQIAEANKARNSKTISEADKLNKKLRANAVLGLSESTHPVVRQLLNEGNLRGALHALSIMSSNSRVSNIARVLSESLEVSNTKVKVTNNLKDEVGERVAGFFEPKTNTVHVDSEIGINPHTILHETTHALTSHIIANKSHPLTKQLNKLFNNTKDMLDTAYGAESLDEFVAEAFGNPEFQQKLAGINPKGSPLSSLQQFFGSISNFIRGKLGLKTRPVTALDEADALIHAMLSPAPDSRNAGAIYMNSTGENMREVLKRITAMRNSMPKLTPKHRKTWGVDAVNFLKDTRTPVKMKEWLTYIAHSLALADVASHYKIQSGYKMHIAIEELEGEKVRLAEKLDATLTNILDWVKANNKDKTLIKTFNNVVYTSTRWQVDPSKPKKDYLTKGGAETDRSKQWWAMQKEWKRLEATGGDKIYLEMRDQYKKLFMLLKEVIDNRIDVMTEVPTVKGQPGKAIDDAVKEKLKQDVFEKLFQKTLIDPYFPLTRKGDYWLEFEGVDPITNTPETVYMAFEGPRIRRGFIRELQKDKRIKNIRPFERLRTIKQLKKAPATGFMSDVLQTLRANKVDDEVVMDFMNLFLDALPESSFAKSLTRRANDGMGRPGYIEDAISAFRTKAYDLSSAIARMKYSAIFDDIQEEMEKEYADMTLGGKPDATADHSNARVVVDSFIRRAEFARNPPPDALFAGANRLAFMGTIGWNFSSATVNGTQIPLFMYPMLGGEYGFDRAAVELWEAAGLVGTSNVKRTLTNLTGDKQVRVWSMIGIDNYFVDDTTPGNEGKLKINPISLKGMDKAKIAKVKDLQTLVEIARLRGQTGRSMWYDTLALQASGREKNNWDRLNMTSAWMIHQVERMNRQVGMTATYHLELRRLGLGDRAGAVRGEMTAAEQKLSPQEKRELAANTAINRTQHMNGGAFLGTAPPIAQKGLGRVAMMYKTYGVFMYYTVLRTGRQMTLDYQYHLEKDGGYGRAAAKTMADTAFRQFAATLLSSVALAGVQGLPFIGIILGLLNLFSSEDEEDAETILRKAVGEGWWKGGLVYGTEQAGFGTDIATRIGLGNLIFRLNPYSGKDDLKQIIFEGAGGPFTSVVTTAWRGGQDIVKN